MVLREKYGDNISSFTPVEGTRWPRFESRWWKDLMVLEAGVGVNWFSSRVEQKVVNGRGASFWNDRWIGEQSLAITFPQLFSLSLQKDAKVGDLWHLHNGVVSWNFNWRRDTFLWENNLMDNLLHLLRRVSLEEEEDEWIWLPEEGGMFSVSSTYKLLEEFMVLEDGLSVEEEEVFIKLWRNLAPSKVVAFSWMALMDRIPTRSNLAYRRILAPGEPCGCVLCGHGDKITTHLFVHCEVVVLIWRKVLDWLGINFITPRNLFMHFACWSYESNSSRSLKAFWLIWHASVWSIWKERNAKIFKNQSKNYDEVVDDIKALSWVWSSSKLRIASCLFYEWCWNLRECLKRRGCCGATRLFDCWDFSASFACCMLAVFFVPCVF